MKQTEREPKRLDIVTIVLVVVSASLFMFSAYNVIEASSIVSSQSSNHAPLPMYKISWVKGENMTFRNAIYYFNFSAVQGNTSINYKVLYVNIDPVLDGQAFVLDYIQQTTELPPAYGTTFMHYSMEFAQNWNDSGLEAIPNGSYMLVFVVYGTLEIHVGNSTL